MDIVLRVSRLPQRGETLHCSELVYIPGGKGANQAVGAARLGMSVRMIGAVGSDEHGTTLLRGLAANGVEIEAITRLDGNSGLAFINVDDQAHNTIVLAGGANQKVTPLIVEQHRGLIEQSSALLVQLEIPLESVARGIELAHEAHVPIFMNAAPAYHLPPEVLRLVDCLIVNQTEAAVLLNDQIVMAGNAADAAAGLCELGVKQAIITLGEQGAILVGPRLCLRMPVYPVKVVDSTAAGDAFVAAFLVGIVHMHLESEQALQMGCAAGAAACTVFGAQPSLPTLDRVIGLQRMHSDLREKSSNGVQEKGGTPREDQAGAVRV
jgi:ribokinase